MQLEIKGGNVSKSSGNNAQISAAGLGTIGGWIEPVHNIPTEVRGLPDGQHDDDDANAACRQPLVPIQDSANIELETSQNCVSDSSNSLKNNISKEERSLSQEKTFYNLSTNRPDVTSEVSSDCEKLWPNLSNQTALLKDLPTLGMSLSKFSSLKDGQSNGHSSLSLPNLEEEGACSLPLNQPLVSCPLDVLPTDTPSSVRSMVTHEGHHPDILDMRQSSQDENSSLRLSLNAEFPPHSEERKDLEQNHRALPDADHLLPDIQKEVSLLPDLMSASNNSSVGMALDMPQIAEISNPAIVTENTLNCLCRSDEPAIVQESQSSNRIPEVVNVHQSTEHNIFQKDKLMEMQRSNLTLNENNSSSIPFDNLNESFHSRDNQENENICNEIKQSSKVSSLAFLPDISASCADVNVSINRQSIDDSQINTDRSEVHTIRFDPCANIDETELDAELEELEKEQVALQGAYNNSGFHSHQGATHHAGGQVTVSCEPTINTNSTITTIQQAVSISKTDESHNSSLSSEALKETETISTSNYCSSGDEKEGSVEARLNIGDLETNNCQTGCTIVSDSKLEATMGGTCISNEPENELVGNQEIESLYNASLVPTSFNNNETTFQTKPDNSNEVSIETTDTLLLTSNLNDLESASPEHCASSLEQAASLPPVPDSPSRETPG